MAVDILRKVREKERGLGVVDVREAARLTQDQLAEILTDQGTKTSKQTVSNIERGYSGASDLRRLEEIARACAGRGWLPDDEDEVLAYILGNRKDLPVVMRRRHLNPGGDGDGVPSKDTHADIRYFRQTQPDLREQLLTGTG